MRKTTAIAAALLAAVLVTPTLVGAQDFNTQEVTYLTFSGPVEMPHLMLPAGTYTFRLADTGSRNVVEVLTRDSKKMLGHFLFIQAQRREATDETVIMFKESPENTRPAIQYWYYPGRTIGKEFIYPKSQAKRIAARTHSKVSVSEAANTPAIGAIDQGGNLTPLAPIEPEISASAAPPVSSIDHDTVADTQNTASNDLTPDSGAISAPAEERPVGTSGRSTETNQVASNELPQTSSPLTLIGLFGVLSLVGGLGARVARQ